jgi:hypothetical protein
MLINGAAAVYGGSLVKKAAAAYFLNWTGLDWTGLDWTGLDWTGLDWNCSKTAKKELQFCRSIPSCASRSCNIAV